MDRTARLPLEILLRSFDSLSPQTLLSVMSVCKVWRETAQNHPAFWHNLDISAISDAALHRFRTRLRHKPTSPVKLHIHLPLFLQRDVAVDVVLPLVISSLHRAEALSLCLNVRTSPAVFRALASRAAPLLKAFDVVFWGPLQEYSVPLPLDLFKRTAPLLRSIVLQGVGLFDSWPDAFCDVVSAVLTFHPRSRHPLPWDLLDAFLHLKTLWIGGGLVYNVPPRPTPTIRRALARLDEFRLYLHDGTPPDIFRWDEMAAIPSIHTYERIPDIGLQLLSHLHSDLELMLRMDYSEGDDAGRFEVVFTSRANQFRRIFLDNVAYYVPDATEPWISAALNLPDMHSRVVQFTIPAYLWRTVGRRLAPLSACLDFVLEMDDCITLAELAVVPLTCPVLRRVTMRSEITCIRYDAVELSSFLATALSITQPIQLTLERGIVQGDQRSLHGLVNVRHA